MTAAVTGFFNLAGWTSPDKDYYSGTVHSGTTVGSGSLTVAMDGSESLQLRHPNGDVPLNTYRWLHGSLLIPDWSPTAGETTVLLYTETGFAGKKGPQLFAVETNSQNNFLVQLRESNGVTILGTGTTVYTFATEYEYRIESNGSTAVLDFGPAGIMTEEVNATYTQQMEQRVRFICSNVNAAVDVIYKPFGYHTSPDRQTRQRTITVLALPHNDNTPQVDEYPTIWPIGATDKSIQVDDYETGGGDGSLTYIASAIAKGETEGQTLVTPNISLATVQALKVTLEHRLITEDKDATMGALIGDGSSGEHSHTVFDNNTTYHFHRAVFTTDANGNAWTQARLNDVQYGHELTVGPEDLDVVNARLTAVHAEAIGSTADPPPVGTAGRNLIIT